MEEVKIQSTPNQVFDYTSPDGNFYVLHLYSFGEMTYADVQVNGVDAVSGVLCVPDQNIIPSSYLNGTGGNFRFTCKDDNYPYYVYFGNSHSLFYYTNKELAAL